MSLDSIVRITIDTKSLQMAQMGFGTPLIIANENDAWSERVKLFKDVDQLGPINQKSPLYLMAKSLMAQNPTVRLAKVGTRAKGESIETALQAIINEDGDFYGVLLTNMHGDDAEGYVKDVESLATALQGKRLLAGVDLAEHHLAVAEKLKAEKCRNVFFTYQPKADHYVSAALMGKMLSQTPGSASWAFKELTGVAPQKLTLDLGEKLKSINVNRYISINDVGITLDGKVAKGEYIDVIHGIDWLHVRLQERLFRLFILNEKIPYTAKGVDLIRCEIMAQLNDAVYRGFLADDPPPIVSIPDVLTIEPSNRENRVLPDVHFSGRIAGAIHEIEIRGIVTP